MNEDKRKTNWRLWLVGALLVLVLIVALQNSQEVEVEVLFVETKTPLIAALLIALGVGALVGYVAPVLRRHRGDRGARHE